MTRPPILPDAAPGNWVDRWAPAPLRPWLQLGRFDRPAGIWLLMLPGWQGVALACAERGRAPDWRLLLLIAVGAALMRAAGCAYNDIVDRDIDAQVARTAGRPLPSGRLSLRQAWAFVVGCCLLALGVLLSLNLLAVALGMASLALVAAYPFMKRITWWPQAWLGLTFNWGALLGYAAALGGTTAWGWLGGAAKVAGGSWTGFGVLDPAHGLTWAALALYAGGVAWTLGYDTIYAVQDLEDDALAGVKSSARRLGAAAPKAVLGFYALALFLACLAAILAELGPLFWPPAALYGMHLAAQARRLDLADPAGALSLFKSNRDAGLLLFAALAAGLWRP